MANIFHPKPAREQAAITNKMVKAALRGGDGSRHGPSVKASADNTGKAAEDDDSVEELLEMRVASAHTSTLERPRVYKQGKVGDAVA